MTAKAMIRRLRRIFPMGFWGRTAMASAGVTLLGWLGAKAGLPTSILWHICAIILAVSLLRLSYLWIKRRFMWRLRNRLIVTYIFMAVIPVLLLATIAIISGYLFSGQFASYVVANNLNSDLHSLAAYTQALAPTPAAITASGGDGREVALFSHSGTRLAATAEGGALSMPGGKQESHQSLIYENGRLFLRCSRSLPDGSVLLTSEVLDSARLAPVAQTLGIIEIYAPHSQLSETATPEETFGELLSSPASVTAGTLPDPAFRFDYSFNYPVRNEATDWRTGLSVPLVIVTRTRPSLLYSCLFLTLGENTNFVMTALSLMVIFFAIIEAIALMIGIRLSRTMTSSVSELYRATQHINRGEFSHRINVRRSDQLASLESSFNSMTASIEKLLGEQKEKHRIDSELAIAHEVQSLLFPSDRTELEGLEVHGICRPARTVSGDYYDFLPMDAGRLGLAVGDISGKGISAALMMATVHAFVRAYTLGNRTTNGTTVHGLAPRQPAELLALLNDLIFEATPQEKYATLFLSIYDQSCHSLSYSNAGHLPPFIIGADGSVRKLETGGTVVGLFANMEYAQETVTLAPGDIFAAFSDGITEPENEFGEFGEERLAHLIRENRHLPLDRISAAVIAAVDDWIGSAEQPDDVTLVLAKAR